MRMTVMIRRLDQANEGIVIFAGNMSNASVLQHQGSIISSAAIIGIVIVALLVIMMIADAILCCANKSGTYIFISKL